MIHFAEFYNITLKISQIFRRNKFLFYLRIKKYLNDELVEGINDYYISQLQISDKSPKM